MTGGNPIAADQNSVIPEIVQRPRQGAVKSNCLAIRS